MTLTGTANSISTRDDDTKGAAALFGPIRAPIMHSVDPHKVAAFLKERQRYEEEVAARQVELPSLSAVPWKASIDRTLLHNMILGDLEEVSPDVDAVDKVTDDQLEKYIRPIVGVPSAGYDPDIIKRAISGFKITMDVQDTNARVKHFISDCFERLESVGCGNFRVDNAKRTVASFLSKVEPYALRKSVKERIPYESSL